MRYLLNQIFNKDATLSNLIGAMKGGRHIAMGNGAMMLEPLHRFVEDPAGYTHDLFKLIASAPRELAEQAAELIKEENESLNTANVQDNMHLAKLAREMGAYLDQYTKAIASQTPWKTIYGGTIPVTRIWRTKKDEVIGEPLVRNVMVDNMHSRLASMVIADDGSRANVMISVSDGRYREDPGSEPVREDFLIDIPAMFAKGLDDGFVKGRRASPGLVCNLLNKMAVEAMPLLSSIEAMAKELSRRGALVDDDLIFERHNFEPARKGLNPEDSPNALITIGSWA
jgi:hypothetical protein